MRTSGEDSSEDLVSALSLAGTERSSAGSWPVRHRCSREIAVINHTRTAAPLLLVYVLCILTPRRPTLSNKF